MFPADIYVDIFEHLDYQSLLKCMQVCSLFRELVNDTASLQYIIELAASGQTNGPNAPGTTSASRLEHLKKHQSNWGSSKWSRELRVPLWADCSWELYGSILGQCTLEGKLTLNQLPSDLRFIEEKVWTLDLGFYPDDFIMDPSQDLLVLTERPNWNAPVHSIHLRSLSDGKPHPLARDTPILFHPQVRGREVSYINEIWGTFLAVYFWLDDGGSEIAIWNWITHEVQVNIYANDIRSFSFLSDTLVVLATVDEAQCPRLVVTDFQQESSEPHHLDDLENTVTFFYPDFRAKFFGIDIRVDPWRPNSKLQTPFFRDTSQVLFVVSLWISMSFDTNMQCLLQFLPSNTLTSLIKNETIRSRFYEWDEWGPQGSRLLFPSHDHRRSDSRNCFVHGWKYATLEDDASKDGIVARLYDFNQVAIKRNYRDPVDEETCADEDRWVYQRAGTSVIPGVFTAPVETTLPYRSQVLPLKNIHGQWLVHCTEDQIIVVERQSPVSHGEYRFLIF